MTFEQSHRPVTPAELASIEAGLKLMLPAALKDQYLRSNGGSPDPYVYLDDELDTTVSFFLPIVSDRGRGSAVQSYQTLVIQKQLTPPNFFPFAVDSGGDYFFVDCASEAGDVYFYASDDDVPLRRLNVSIRNFWDQLQPDT